MAIEKKQNLCLFEIKPITLKDGTPKWKYTFFDAEDKLVTGYADRAEGVTDVKKAKLADKIVTVPCYDQTKASEFLFVGKVWDNALTWRLLV